MPALLDLTGMRFGRLVAKRIDRTEEGRPRWLCRCDCGTTKALKVGELRSGNTRSCGCLQREVVSAGAKVWSRKHGHTIGPYRLEHRIWASMILRCANPADHSYARYGARGITVCERWLKSFDNFIADMGPRPSRDLSIERNNNEGPYEPNNCRWATDGEQARNKRNNRWLIVRGKRMTLAEAVAISPMATASAIHQRLDKGWSDEDAVLTPSRR